MTDSDSNIVDVTPIGKEKPARLTKDDVEKDYEYTRGNLYSLIFISNVYFSQTFNYFEIDTIN